MTRTAEQIIKNEVHYCVSYLVSTLAMGCHATTFHTGEGEQLADLTAQAVELAAPIADWEEAATQAGLSLNPDDAKMVTWEGVCMSHDIEPYDREVFEHWIVSNWLADKLEAKGEKVDRDFAGMTVWARTTTGQAISMDSVIEAIHADLIREYGE